MDYFSKNKRLFVIELMHIFKVGLSLLKDTWRLYKRLEQIKRKEGSKVEPQ